MYSHKILQSNFGDQFWLVLLLLQIMIQVTSYMDFHPIDSQWYHLYQYSIASQLHPLYCYLESGIQTTGSQLHPHLL